MRGRLIFAAGMGVGYLLGARAGRERFEQIVSRGRRVWDSPTVQEAAGVVQAQAGRLYDTGKKAAGDQLHKVSHRNGNGHTNGKYARVAAGAGQGHFPPERGHFPSEGRGQQFPPERGGQFPPDRPTIPPDAL